MGGGGGAPAGRADLAAMRAAMAARCAVHDEGSDEEEGGGGDGGMDNRMGGGGGAPAGTPRGGGGGGGGDGGMHNRMGGGDGGAVSSPLSRCTLCRAPGRCEHGAAAPPAGMSGLGPTEALPWCPPAWRDVEAAAVVAADAALRRFHAPPTSPEWVGALVAEPLGGAGEWAPEAGECAGVLRVAIEACLSR